MIPVHPLEALQDCIALNENPGIAVSYSPQKWRLLSATPDDAISGDVWFIDLTRRPFRIAIYRNACGCGPGSGIRFAMRETPTLWCPVEAPTLPESLTASNEGRVST